MLPPPQIAALIGKNVAVLSDHPGYESKPRPMLTLSELQKVLKWEGVPLWRAPWVFLAETGYRPSEARTLHWGEITKDGRMYMITKADAKTTAGRQPRPISDLLYGELLTIKADSLFVFANPETGRPFHERTINDHWDTAVLHALNTEDQIYSETAPALEKRNLYQLRKFFGRSKAKHGSDNAVKKLMGHTDIRTTKMYYLDAEMEEMYDLVCQSDILSEPSEEEKA